MWELKTTTIPVAMGALGTIKKDMENHTNEIPDNINVHELQKITPFSTAHLLRRVLSIGRKPLCLPKSMVRTRMLREKINHNYTSIC